MIERVKIKNGLETNDIILTLHSKQELLLTNFLDGKYISRVESFDFYVR